MSRSDGDIDFCYHPVSCRIHSDFKPLPNRLSIIWNFIFQIFVLFSTC